MIPVSTLYDEYIDLPKLSEQKNPFEYLVPPPPPSRGVGTITYLPRMISVYHDLDVEKI